ncbi:MAG: hypothetical protein Q9174_000812 [Haloplaca sp. 1 TL-2023]
MKRKRGSTVDLSLPPPPAKQQNPQLSHVTIPITVNKKPDTSQQNAAEQRDGNLIPPQQSCQEDQSDRMDWHPAQPDKQHAPHAAVSTDLPTPPVEPPEQRRPTTNQVRPSVEQLQDTIEAQFGLEILLKHKELRLIDQEIAKCQVAQEQLRRCHLIPYPAMSSSWEDMQAVVTGMGIMPESQAPNASPWGVMSGPYTRHYKQWLIPDTTFGDHVVQHEASTQVTATPTGRTVRASTAGKSSLASKSRSQRAAANTRLKALPPGYPEPKEDKGPMLLKRSTDGQMVKLVCLDCRRSDFNSVQGFINHCRIAHSRNFQSHDAAAIACGEEVELDQAGGIVGETGTTPNVGAGLVHPLVRSAHVARQAAPTPPMKFSRSSASATETPTQPARSFTIDEPEAKRLSTPGSVVSTKSASTSFKPSPQTPHLSALFARSGRSADLEEEVGQAKLKMEIDSLPPTDDEADDEDVVETSQPLTGPISHSTRGPVRPDHAPSQAAVAPVRSAPSTSARPAKVERHSISPHLAPHGAPMHLRGAGPTIEGHAHMDAHRRNHKSLASPTLSPNTVESHQAPSLISDDDDCENTHSECSSAADLAEDLERHYFGMDFETSEDQAMADMDATGRGAGAKALPLGSQPKANSHVSQTPRRSSAMRSPDAIRDPTVSTERHVTFASPHRRPRKKMGK